MIQEDYVSFELAKKLKEKGFPQEELLPENSYDASGNYPASMQDLMLYHGFCCYRPSLYVAQKWLREEKNLCINVDCNTIVTDTGKEYYATIINHNKKLWGISGRIMYEIVQNPVRYSTYKEALEAGIEKALELI